MKTMNKRRLLLLAAVAALLLAGVGGTIAYIVTQTEPVVNTFEATHVAVEVQNDYRIKNTGDIKAYIRAAVVVTWQDASGNVYAQKPDVDLFTENDGWTLNDADGYYYYNTPVASGEFTSALVEIPETLPDPPADGYNFTVEILAQGIQSEPASVVGDVYVWGYTPSGN